MSIMAIIKDNCDYKNYIDNNGYDYVEVTSGMNGYPKNLKVSAIGFDTFEDAESFAKEVNGSVVSLHRKYGWDFWEAECDMWSSYNMEYLMESNYDVIYHKEDYENEYDFLCKEDIHIRMAECCSLAEMMEFVNDMKSLWESIQGLKDGEFLAYSLSADVYPKNSMKYEFDSSEYVIGVIVYEYGE